MKINDFELKVVCANYDNNIGGYGDIYTCVEDCLNDHPDDRVIYGFVLVRDDVDNTPDWFDTIEEAIRWASDC